MQAHQQPHRPGVIATGDLYLIAGYNARLVHRQFPAHRYGASVHDKLHPTPPEPLPAPSSLLLSMLSVEYSSTTNENVEAPIEFMMKVDARLVSPVRG